MVSISSSGAAGTARLRDLSERSSGCSFTTLSSVATHLSHVNNVFLCVPRYLSTLSIGFLCKTALSLLVASCPLRLSVAESLAFC